MVAKEAQRGWNLAGGSTIHTQPETALAGVAAQSGLNTSPVMFIENVGQLDSQVRFQVQGALGNVYLAPDAIWATALEKRTPQPGGPTDPNIPPDVALLNLPDPSSPRAGVNLRFTFAGADLAPRVEGFNRLDTRVSYFIGNDADKWRPNVPVWGGVRYVDIYPGVDLEITSENGEWAWRMVARDTSVRSAPDLTARTSSTVTPGTLQVEGVQALEQRDARIRLETAIGDYSLPQLGLVTSSGTTVLPAIERAAISVPEATQGSPSPSPTGAATGTPTGTETGLPSITPTGTTTVPAIPSGTPTATETASPHPNPTATDQPAPTLTPTADVPPGETPDETATLNPAEALTGTPEPDTAPLELPTPTATGFVTGYLPVEEEGRRRGVAARPALKEPAGLPASSTNDLLYSTYLGGSSGEQAFGIAVDDEGAAYITGETFSSWSLPTLPGYEQSVQGDGNVFVLKLDPTGSALEYFTYLGGEDYERGNDIALNSAQLRKGCRPICGAGSGPAHE